MEFFDISPPLTERVAVYPGDEPFSRKVLLDFKRGDHLLLSSTQSTLHVGAHVDAPNHYDPNGMGIGLYFVKRVVEDHGGKVWVESEGTGKGSTFFVELPIK